MWGSYLFFVVVVVDRIYILIRVDGDVVGSIEEYFWGGVEYYEVIVVIES